MDGRCGSGCRPTRSWPKRPSWCSRPSESTPSGCVRPASGNFCASRPSRP